MINILLRLVAGFNRDQLLTSKVLDLEVKTPPSGESEEIL